MQVHIPILTSLHGLITLPAADAAVLTFACSDDEDLASTLSRAPRLGRFPLPIYDQSPTCQPSPHLSTSTTTSRALTVAENGPTGTAA